MTREFTPRIQELCALVAKEKDPRKFIQLVEELNRLLVEKDPKPQKPLAVVKAPSVA
jgi:hypothetical protein